MAATAINGIRLSKSGAKAGLVVDGGFNAGWPVMRSMGWRGRRLVQSATKPNIRCYMLSYELIFFATFRIKLAFLQNKIRGLAEDHRYRLGA